MGRLWPNPKDPTEPQWLREDTNLAIALHEQEQAEAAERCSSCGLPKSICRDKANQWRFDAEAEQCHATYAMAIKGGAKPNEATDRARQVSAHLRH